MTYTKAITKSIKTMIHSKAPRYSAYLIAASLFVALSITACDNDVLNLTPCQN